MTIKEYEQKWNRDYGNNFAEACACVNSISEIIHAQMEEPDEGSMIIWCLTTEEWNDGLSAALTELRAVS